MVYLQDEPKVHVSLSPFYQSLLYLCLSLSMHLYLAPSLFSLSPLTLFLQRCPPGVSGWHHVEIIQQFLMSSVYVFEKIETKCAVKWELLYFWFVM